MNSTYLAALEHMYISRLTAHDLAKAKKAQNVKQTAQAIARSQQPASTSKQYSDSSTHQTD